MKDMREERYYATTVLNDDGNMWVMGGYAGNNPKKATEIFKYKAPPRKGRWKKGKPLPADLRDSGIESHCSFALNKTHIFMGKTSLNLIKYCNLLLGNHMICRFNFQPKIKGIHPI